MTLTAGATEVPVKIVGSSKFGRYPIISGERTYNMFISDDWLISFAGYESVLELLTTDVEGRALYHSVRGDFLIAVAGAIVYRIDNINLNPVELGTIATETGEVFIDENLSSQIAIVDGSEIYIYYYGNGLPGTFGLANLSSEPSGFVPNYVTYQNTYFIFGNGASNNSGSQWPIYSSGYITAGDELKLTLAQTLTLQTKPDYARAALRIPGKGNNLIVFGTTVAEIWTQVPTAQVYQRASSVNIDFGLLSVSTLAASDEIVAWLGINEKSTPSIMVMTGGGAQRISTDGIDYLLATIRFPTESTAFFFRQDGHLFYQLTFFNEADNITVIYDFNTDKFYDLTDWDFNYHPARQIAYFNGFSYFISLKDARIYRTGSDLTTYNVEPNLPLTIPRSRICDTFRGESPERFRVNLFTFTIENGTEPGENFAEGCVGYILNEETNLPIYTEDDLPILMEGGYCGDQYRPRIDVTISKNGAQTFSNAVPYFMHATGHYKNQPRFYRLGACNQFTIQMRFWGMWRFVIKDGLIEVTP